MLDKFKTRCKKKIISFENKSECPDTLHRIIYSQHKEILEKVIVDITKTEAAKDHEMMIYYFIEKWDKENDILRKEYNRTMNQLVKRVLSHKIALISEVIKEMESVLLAKKRKMEDSRI